MNKRTIHTLLFLFVCILSTYAESGFLYETSRGRKTMSAEETYSLLTQDCLHFVGTGGGGASHSALSSTIYTLFSADYQVDKTITGGGEGIVKRKVFGGEGMGSDYDDDPNRSNASPMGEAGALLALAVLWLMGKIRKGTIINQD